MPGLYWSYVENYTVTLGTTEAGEALISRLGVAGGDQEERGRKRRRKRMEKQVFLRQDGPGAHGWGEKYILRTDGWSRNNPGDATLPHEQTQG